MTSAGEQGAVVTVDADEQHERAHTTSVLLRAGAALLTLVMVISIVLRPLPLAAHAPYALMIGCHLIALALVRRGRVQTGVVAFAVSYLAVVLFALARGGGELAPAGFVLPPVVLFVGLTLSGRAAIVTALAASVGLFGVLALERRGLLPDPVSAPPVRIWLVATTTLIITGVMLAAASRVIRESRARVAAAQRARAELEARLVQARRLETVGRLAAGVAHDFNNVLTVVFAEASRLGRGDARTAKSAGNILAAAERAAALTRQLLSFGRRQVREPEPEQLELGEVARRLEGLLGKLVGEDVRLEVQIDGDASVCADRTELEQVLLNLVTNARDAMPRGGPLTIRTGVATAAMRARCPGLEGEAVFVAVSDRGAGIEPAVRARLFEPFFTTKAIGKGTGLGLATVEQIVRQAGGAMLVDSELGVGSTFTAVLPAAKPAAAAQARSATPVEAARGTAVDVLIVDDDALVRAAIETIVSDGGHRVTSVGSAADALDAATRWQRPPALLVTDVVMADMAGGELARRLRALHPELRVLFVSGYAEERLSERGVMASGVHFVAKPFERTALLAKIDAVLASDNLGATGPG